MELFHPTYNWFLGPPWARILYGDVMRLFSLQGMKFSHEFRLAKLRSLAEGLPSKFNSSPVKIYLPNRKGSSSNHHFSGATLNFGGVTFSELHSKKNTKLKGAQGIREDQRFAKSTISISQLSHQASYGSNEEYS